MFSEYSEDGIQTTCVDMNTFIRLFVNHRPVYGIGKGNIDEAKIPEAKIAKLIG